MVVFVVIESALVLVVVGMGAEVKTEAERVVVRNLLLRYG
jgi:hypothetical protein